MSAPGCQDVFSLLLTVTAEIYGVMVVTGNLLGSDIAGAMARFWAGGEGPSHSSISSAFALAGYDEPGADGTKEQRVLRAIRFADDATAKNLVEELLNLLRSFGVFEQSSYQDSVVAGLSRACTRRGFKLWPEGFIDWELDGESSRQKVGEQSPLATVQSRQTPAAIQATVPTVELLVSSLRRLASALRPLVLRRRSRPSFIVRDEYDLQDVVEALLRSLYNDVRPEERTPSYAGSSSVMDFLLKDDHIAIEVKVTTPGRKAKHIKPELLVDVCDYQGHPAVQTLIAVVYDLASTIDNPSGFEIDLSGQHGTLSVTVVVVGWPLPAATSGMD